MLLNFCWSVAHSGNFRGFVAHSRKFVFIFCFMGSFDFLSSLRSFPCTFRGANPVGVSVGPSVHVLCLQQTHQCSCSSQGWFHLAVFAHGIPAAPCEPIPEPTLQELIPNPLQMKTCWCCTIPPCQLPFHSVFFFLIFTYLLLTSPYSPLPITPF